ncbi:MAG: peptide-methionine (S)-S-oxide reductase MsrA [Bacteroidota bacterium]
MNQHEGMETATLAGGCFWCLEAVFKDLRGVARVESGYTGGGTAAPTYEQVCTGRTGHAEAVQITFDPRLISFRDLLRVFFTAHDPTTRNRQGADVGTQYRSAVFYHTTAQKDEAERVVAGLDREGLWPAPIVTEIKPYTVFYPAEEYHRDYYARHPDEAYCRAVIAPKVAKFRRENLARLKPEDAPHDVNGAPSRITHN